MNIELNTVYNESALVTLKRMPDDFLDCCITSPPFYGLRSYGTPPQIWDGDENCEHEFGEIIPNPKQDLRSPEQKAEQGGQVGNNLKTSIHSPGNSGQFCQLCGAWRGELGLEPTVFMFIDHLQIIFAEIYRALKPTGTCFVNIADSYASAPIGHKTAESINNSSTIGAKYKDDHLIGAKFDKTKCGVKPKSLMNVPSRFALMMTDDLGFIQRNQIIWHKLSAMPSSATDRFSTDYEPVFFFVKSPKYYFEQQFEKARGPIQPRSEIVLHENSNVSVPYNRAGNPHGDMRNMRCVWEINTANGDNRVVEHYAAYPIRLLEIPIKAGCPEGGIIYDPFSGTATTAIVAIKLGRNFIASELQDEYFKQSCERLQIEQAKGTLF